MLDSVVALFESTIRTSTPLVLAAMGTLIAERAGVINLAVEGQILIGAFVGASVTYLVGSPEVGLIAAGFSGLLVSMVLGLFTLKGRADQVVTGMTLNLLAFGLVPILGRYFFENSGSTPSISLEQRASFFPALLVIFVPAIIYLIFKKTSFGIKIIFAGEKPQSLEAAGYNPIRIKLIAYLFSGFLAGVAGWTLSVFLSSGFARGMSGGRGFIALAAMIMGRWRPLETLIICLFFGLSESIQIQLQGVILFGNKVPVQFIQILPYVLVMIALGGLIQGARPPKYLGD